MSIKECTKCNENKEYCEFHINKRYDDGYCRVCKKCKRKYDQNNYLEHKDKKMNKIEIWQMLNPEKVKKHVQTYRAKRKSLTKSKI